MMRVLAVDDQQADRYIIKKLLSPYFQVTTLSSAREALSFALSHPFDVALLNVMLKEDLDGIELLKDLRNIQGQPFRAIAITCHIDDGRYHKILRSGFEGLIRKPLDVDEFSQLVYRPVMIPVVSDRRVGL